MVHRPRAKRVWEEVSGIEMDNWVYRYTFGTEKPDYKKIFANTSLHEFDGNAGNTSADFGTRLGVGGQHMVYPVEYRNNAYLWFFQTLSTTSL